MKKTVNRSNSSYLNPLQPDLTILPKRINIFFVTLIALLLSASFFTLNVYALTTEKRCLELVKSKKIILTGSFKDSCGQKKKGQECQLDKNPISCECDTGVGGRLVGVIPSSIRSTLNICSPACRKLMTDTGSVPVKNVKGYLACGR